MQQLEIIVKKAIGLKHDGRHCVEFLLDGHSPERTHWVDDLYDTSGAVVQPKNFRNSRRCIRLKGGPDSYQGAFLHIALFHQRNIREDKRAAEAHLPFSAVRSFSGWVALEHKEKYGGKIFIEASLKDAAPPPSPAQPAVAAVLDDPELAEQMAILASIQSSHETKPSTKDSVPSWPSSWPQVPTNSAPAQPAQLALPAPAPISPPTAAAQMADLAEPAEWLPWPRFRAAWPKVPTPVTSAAPARSPRRKALLIGLDYLGTAAERFGRAGRRDMAEVAAILARLGFPEEWILKLPEEEATRQNCLAAMCWLSHNCAPGDVFFFHFSGHSALQPVGDSFLDAFCPIDFAEAGFLSMRDAYEAMVLPLCQKARLTMLVDCCVPCGLELPYLWDLSAGRWADGELPKTGADVVGLAGSVEEMTQEQLAQARNAERGPVTSAFLRAMQELAQRRKPVSYAELLRESGRFLGAEGSAFQLQLGASLLFDPSARTFRFFDVLD